jgi:hypothetical protein
MLALHSLTNVFFSPNPQIFKEYIDDAFSAQEPELVKELQKKKLVNAGVARVLFDFGKGGGASKSKTITEVQLLFGTTLVN